MGVMASALPHFTFGTGFDEEEDSDFGCGFTGSIAPYIKFTFGITFYEVVTISATLQLTVSYTIEYPQACGDGDKCKAGESGLKGSTEGQIDLILGFNIGLKDFDAFSAEFPIKLFEIPFPDDVAEHCATDVFIPPLFYACCYSTLQKKVKMFFLFWNRLISYVFGL